MVKAYKYSRYNFKVKDKNNQSYLYNSLTGALAKLDDDEERMLQQNGEAEKFPIGEKFLAELRFGGFLIDADFEELDLIRYQMQSARFDRKQLCLTIAPTMDCNFRCEYCYEKENRKSGLMNESVISDLIHFIDERLDDCTGLNITWYGGEPLLAADTIHKISMQLINRCNDKDINYSASMISNGYLLNRKNIEIINECQIKFIQITLDGDEESHDKRRYLANGNGTFGIILQNLKDNKDIIPPISLRVNIDKSNPKALYEVQNIIDSAELSDKVKIYPGRITSINGCCSSANCMTDEEFSALETEYYLETKDGIHYLFPRRIISNCCADHFRNCVIDNNGIIYKCWDDIGYADKSVGSLKDGIFPNRTYLEYILTDPTMDPECKNCSVLPICLGGCPHEFQTNRKCSKYKFSIAKILINFVNKIEAVRREE